MKRLINSNKSYFGRRYRLNNNLLNYLQLLRNFSIRLLLFDQGVNMSILKSSLSSALPITYIRLRILIVLNWLMSAGILALLIVSIANEPWFMSAFNLSALPGADWMAAGLRAIAVLGFAATPLHYAVLIRLLAIRCKFLIIYLS
jgi:hypothetical protein